MSAVDKLGGEPVRTPRQLAERHLAYMVPYDYDAVRVIARALIAAEDALAWRPIDTAPKDGRFLLLHVPEALESGVVTVGAYWKESERGETGRFLKGHWDGWLGMDADIVASWCEPTHWMPLPAPPDAAAPATLTGGSDGPA